MANNSNNSLFSVLKNDYLVEGRDTVTKTDFSQACSDIFTFQLKFQKIRDFDDKIINILNSELPTESFHKDNTAVCKQFQNELEKYYDSREHVIEKCIASTKSEIEKLVSQPDNPNKFGAIREKNFLLRQFVQESDVDKIYRGRTIQTVEERCRKFK